MRDKIYIYGLHSVSEVIKAGKRKFFKLLVSEQAISKIARDPFLARYIIPGNSFSNHKIPVQQVNSNYFQKFSALSDKNHQGIVLEASQRPIEDLEDFTRKLFEAEKSKKCHETESDDQIPDPDSRETLKIRKSKKVIAILDELTDVGNVGAIFRSALAFGIQDILLTKHNAVSDSGDLVKASSGMADHLNLYQATNLNMALQDLKNLGFWCIGLEMEAKENIEILSNYDKLALILGSENRGLRDLVKRNCDILVKIPISNQVESLNVSAAASIAFYHCKNLT